MCEKLQRCVGKRLKYVGNDLDMRQKALICEKRLKYVTNSLDVREAT